MELKQLEYFCQIADTGSISEAARRLNMSQPPLSYQLHQLEEELQVRLLERSRQGVELTEAGKVLYKRANDLLSYAGSTKLEVAKAGRKRVLRIGITPTTVSTLIPYISRFSQKYPDVNFEVHDGITSSLYNYLMEGIIDVSAVRTPLRLDEVETMTLRTEPMIAVSAAGKVGKTQKTDSLKLEELLGRPLILYRRYENLVMDTFAARHMEPDIFCICDDPRGAILWAREGLATAVFPQSMSGLCEGLCVQTLAEKELETDILLAWRKGKRPEAVVQEFLKLFRSDATQADSFLAENEDLRI